MLWMYAGRVVLYRDEKPTRDRWGYDRQSAGSIAYVQNM